MTGPSLSARALEALEARRRGHLADLAAQGSPAAQDALGRPLVAFGLGGAPCRYGP